MRRFVTLVTLLLCCTPATSAADNRYRFKMDHKIQLWIISPGLRKQQRATPPAKLIVPLLIRFGATPSAQVMAELTAEGVWFYPGARGHKLLHLGVFFPARASVRGLAALKRNPAVLQVDLDAVLDLATPLDLTSKLIGVRDVWPQQVKGVSLAGKGMTFGLIDTGIDVRHPDFFRADGGVYAWLDVDKDGLFTPGTDAVDLDGDGKAGSGETLHSMDAVVWNLYTTKPMLGTNNNTFDANTDWLFADTNGNGKRDYGSAAGYTDASPAFGEPLFLIQDLDGDGALDPEEKVVLLKSSKIKAVYTPGAIRTRGKDLILTESEKTYSHGNCTSGILVGGQRGYHKWVGMAPDAELMVGADYAGTSFGKQFTWLVQSKVDVVLHEYATWTRHHLDGSSNHEGLMDTAAKSGIPQVTPAGNLGGSNKHMRVTIKPGASVNVPVWVPAPSSAGSHSYMHMTFLWRNTKSKLMFTLQDPNGLKQVLPDTPASSNWISWGDGKTYYRSVRQDSSRGTAAMNITIQGGGFPNYKAITNGYWKLWVMAPATAGSVLLLGYVHDRVSGWSKGIQFNKDVSEKGLVCWPATADSAITVGAYAGHVGIPYEYKPTGDKIGWLRKYSGRGVRVDGAQIMDIIAPDNPVAPYNVRSGYSHGLGAYRVFGGTSGAGPHVAGAALLIKQHTPSLTGLTVRAAIRKGALVDKAVGTVPSETWGYGKLRVYNSIYGTDPTPNTPPKAKITFSGPVYAGTPVTLTPGVSDIEDGKASLVIRWDDTYDGTWDTSFASAKARSVTFTKAGTARAKLQVMDTGGLTSAAAVLIKVLPQVTKPDTGTVPPDAGLPDAPAPDLALLDLTAGDLAADGDSAPTDLAQSPDGKPDAPTPDVLSPDLGPDGPVADYFIPDQFVPDLSRDSGPPTDWKAWPDKGGADSKSWTGPQKPEEEGCSCGVAGGNAGLLFPALILLGLLGWRRRRP